jgi:hypothetical protein
VSDDFNKIASRAGFYGALIGKAHVSDDFSEIASRAGFYGAPIEQDMTLGEAVVTALAFVFAILGVCAASVAIAAMTGPLS